MHNKFYLADVFNCLRSGGGYQLGCSRCLYADANVNEACMTLNCIGFGKVFRNTIKHH
jgi:hypothetical protein